MSVTVRAACLDDIPWMTAELREFSKFYGTKSPLMGADEEYVRAGLYTMVTHHVVQVAHHESGELMGFIAGTLTPHVFNPDLSILCENFWWVATKYRKSRAGLLLLEAFIAAGKNYADMTTFSLVEGRSPVNEKSLMKRGFHLHERNYLMETR